MVSISIIIFFSRKRFWVFQLSIANIQERKSEHIMNILLSAETTNFKATSIVLAFVLMIELADGTASYHHYQ